MNNLGVSPLRYISDSINSFTKSSDYQKKCQQLEANAREAVANLNLSAEVSHITDPIEIAKKWVMSTPAMAINGRVVSKGQVISTEQIQPLLQR